MTPVAEPRRFRFAPTPSRELHAGSALAALFGWAMSRAAGGHFAVRIEDIDRTRCRPEHEVKLLSDLAWLGLDWDGPILRQSERLAHYDLALVELGRRGLAYACHCSRADVRAAQSAPHLGLAGEPTELPYPGTCRGQGLAWPAHDASGGLRLHVERLGDRAVVSWVDGLLGPQREDVRTTSGDFLLGRPGQPTYQLAVVVDDIATGITDVVRGRDLLGSTARQLLLHRDLASRDGPRFHHHPLIVDAAGHKLSKRDAALSLAALRASGLDAHALGAKLGQAIGLFATTVARATPADWIDAVAGLSTSDAGPVDALHDGRLVHSAAPA